MDNFLPGIDMKSRAIAASECSTNRYRILYGSYPSVHPVILIYKDVPYHVIIIRPLISWIPSRYKRLLSLPDLSLLLYPHSFEMPYWLLAFFSEFVDLALCQSSVHDPNPSVVFSSPLGLPTCHIHIWLPTTLHSFSIHVSPSVPSHFPSHFHHSFAKYLVSTPLLHCDYNMNTRVAIFFGMSKTF